jgi:hypothetical protein
MKDITREFRVLQIRRIFGELKLSRTKQTQVKSERHASLSRSGMQLLGIILAFIAA